MSVFNDLNTAIYNKLSAGTALTSLLASGSASLYYLQAPDHAARPFVTWNYQGGGDENLIPSRMKNIILFVRAFDDTPASAGSVDAQVDALLHQGTLSVSGWSNFWLARETDLSLVDNLPNGEKVYMAGGFYRVRLADNT